MEFIKLEQFMSQDDKVIEELKNWWEPKRYDLYIDNNDLSLVECMDYIKADIFYSARNNMSYKEDMIPLLTEGQLRKFIEEKTNGIVKLIQWHPSIDNEKHGYEIHILAKDKYKVLCTFNYKLLGIDLLQAYWKVAIQIAKES